MSILERIFHTKRAEVASKKQAAAAERNASTTQDVGKEADAIIKALREEADGEANEKYRKQREAEKKAAKDKGGA